MITQLITMNGHGIYVWASFAVVLVSCSIFYFKTKKTLKKYEKEYLIELKKLAEVDRQILLKKSKIANNIYAASNKAN